MSHRRHENIFIQYPINMAGFQSKLQLVVHALYFQVCPYARLCEIMRLDNSFLRAGMNVEDLSLASPVGTPSIYPRVGVVISMEEVTINHLYCELSNAVLFNILCNPVLFGPNDELAVQPAFTCIPIGSPTEEAESNMVVQRLKEECHPQMHETLARVLLHNLVDLTTIITALNALFFFDNSYN